MYISLTGTPGTGKTAISKYLSQNKIDILHLTDIIENINFKFDRKRYSKIIDIKLLNDYIVKNIKKNYKLLIIEGHLSHLLSFIDKVIILRCHPKELRKRLLKRKWKMKKIDENIEAEILDIILCETLSLHSKKNIFEINTTNLSINSIGSSILDIIKKKFKVNKIYNIGNIDWSEEIFNLKIH